MQRGGVFGVTGRVQKETASFVPPCATRHTIQIWILLLLPCRICRMFSGVAIAGWPSLILACAPWAWATQLRQSGSTFTLFETCKSSYDDSRPFPAACELEHHQHRRAYAAPGARSRATAAALFHFPRTNIPCMTHSGMFPLGNMPAAAAHLQHWPGVPWRPHLRQWPTLITVHPMQKRQETQLTNKTQGGD